MYKVTPNSYFSAVDLIGPDASKTLQGQLTNDIENLREGAGLNGLLCNVKGRIEVVVKVYKHSQEHLTLVVPAVNIDIIKRRLAPYVAFSKSRLSEFSLENHSLIFASSASPPNDATTGLWFDDFALLSPQELHELPLSLTPSSIIEFHKCRVNSGMVQLSPEQVGLYTPQALSLDRLGYVSFRKGCYMGQEIIARLHYKGQSKYQLALVQGSSAIGSESKITNHTGASMGTIVDADANKSGLYLASIRAPSDGNNEYLINNQPVNVLSLFSS